MQRYFGDSMHIRIPKYVAMLLMLMLVVRIPVSGGASRESADNRGETVLRVALQDDIKTVNPLSANDVWTWDVIQWMFDGLTRHNSSNNDHIEPWAAEWFHHGPQATWDTSLNCSDNDNNDDYRNWTVKLMHGVREITAADGVTHTIQAIKWHDWEKFDIDGNGVLDDADATEKQGLVWAHDVIFSLRLMADVPRYSSGIDCVLARNPNGTVMYGRDLPANGTIRMIGWDGENVRELPYWIDLLAQKRYPDLPVVYLREDSDELTLHYFLTYDYVDFTTVTLKSYIFPERIWKNHIADKLTWDDPECLISFGPFKFGHWNHSEESGRINTFRDYFRPEFDEKGRQKPYIDAMEFRVYGTTDAAIMALTTDELDYIAWPIDPGFIDTIVHDPDMSLVRNADLGFFYLAFNMRMPDFGYAGYREEGRETPTYNGNYTDIGKPFRVAMAHLIDKQTIVTKFLQGFGSIGTSVVSPVNSYWYNPNVTIYNYDPDEVKRILDDYAPDSDGDGIRELPYLGEDKITMMELPLDYDPCIYRRSMIQAAAQDAGLNFESKPTNFRTIVNQINQHDFQMYILGWSIPSPLSSAKAPCDFFSSYNDMKNGGNNYPGYHNRSFDRLCDEFMREPDTEKRRNLSRRMQEAIAQDVPYSVLYYRDVLETYSYSFTGWVPRYGTIFNRDSINNLRIGCPPRNGISISIPEKVQGGSPVNLDAYIYDIGTLCPISDAEVYFSVSAGTLSSSSAITDSNGKAEVTFTPPVSEESMVVEIEASYYDIWWDYTARTTKTITVIPPPLPEVKLGMEIRPGYSFTIEENNTLPIEVKVLNSKSGEYYGQYNNSTGSGVMLDCSAFPENADIGIRYDNGTWYVNFTGHAILNITVYDIHLDAVLYEYNGPYATSFTNISAVVLKAPAPYQSENPPAPASGEIPEEYIFAGVGLLAAAAVALLLLFRKKHGKHF